MAKHKEDRSEEFIRDFKENAHKKDLNHKKLARELKKKLSKKALDSYFHIQHEEVFEQMNCLACANCCKTTSPIFYQKDIERIAASLKMRVSNFIENYLKIDEEGDYVLKSRPCPFLGHDHYCMVYDARPKACRGYPHTDRKKMYQILNTTVKNSQVCPAVFKIFEGLETQLSKSNGSL